MGLYATAADLGNLSLNTQATAGLPAAQIAQALQAASDEADSYLNARFNLPLITWGNDLRGKVCDIAAYNLLVARGFNPDDGPDVLVRLRHDDAIKWLKGVAKGENQPILVDSTAIGEPGGAFIVQPRILGTSASNTQLTLGGTPPSISQSSAGGQLYVGAPVLRGW